VPAEWIERRGDLDPRTPLTWANVEQRRAAAEIIGWERVLSQLSPRVLDADPDPQIGTLIEVALPDSPRSKFLRVQCGTGRTFVLPVPSEMTRALQAQAWMWQVNEDTYRQLEIRT
jgi:hypothetical protein